MKQQITSNIFNTALFFEGGSTRAAYTSAVATCFLQQGVYFDMVYGISAGSSNLVNYLSRDIWRTSESFTGFIGDPNVGNVKSFLRHQGLFNVEYIYGDVSGPEGSIPFDFETFFENPAKFCIVSFDRDTGEDLYFTRENVKTDEQLMACVRASSTLPVIMPPPTIDGHVCYDGGFATGGGLPLKRIEEDGYKRVVVIRTRPRGYRKEESYDVAERMFWHRPHMREAIATRSARYNESCDLLDQWEADGRAYVFYPDDLTLTGTERDVNLLRKNFNHGFQQISKELPAILEYVQAGE